MTSNIQVLRKEMSTIFKDINTYFMEMLHNLKGLGISYLAYILYMPLFFISSFSIALFLQINPPGNKKILTKAQWTHQGREWHKNFRQTRIYYFRNKCVIFSRNCKLENLTRHDMQYIQCTSCSRNTVFDSKKSTFLP